MPVGQAAAVIGDGLHLSKKGLSAFRASTEVAGSGKVHSWESLFLVSPTVDREITHCLSYKAATEGTWRYLP